VLAMRTYQTVRTSLLDLAGGFVRSASNDDGDLPLDRPVFPTCEGNVRSKVDMVFTVSMIAKAIGISTDCARSQLCRISDACHLAQINEDRWLIQLMAHG
jgi:hypothetical protein